MENPPAQEPLPRPEPPSTIAGSVITWRDFFVQLVIVTLGVLIALLLQGFVDWRRDQTLLHEARDTIRQELEDNQRELDTEIAGLAKRKSDLDNCLKFVDELLTRGKTDIRSIDLGLSFAEFSVASWQSAERTGALALMEYRDVQSLSKLYDVQGLYVAQQRQELERVANALTWGTGDASKAPRADLEAFRHEVLALQASMLIEGQLAEQLSRAYKNTLADVFK
jgi:hypothetical protein